MTLQHLCDNRLAGTRLALAGGSGRCWASILRETKVSGTLNCDNWQTEDVFTQEIKPRQVQMISHMNVMGYM